MAAEQQWEFCQLILGNAMQQPGGQWAANIAIRYFGAQAKYVALADTGSGRTYHYNPWEYAFGFLGWAGWDLVTVQHGVTTVQSGLGSLAGVLKADNITAYFKRPLQEGRAIDEPGLVLS